MDRVLGLALQSIHRPALEGIKYMMGGLHSTVRLFQRPSVSSHSSTHNLFTHLPPSAPRAAEREAGYLQRSWRHRSHIFSLPTSIGLRSVRRATWLSVHCAAAVSEHLRKAMGLAVVPWRADLVSCWACWHWRWARMQEGSYTSRGEGGGRGGDGSYSRRGERGRGVG